jgi:threonine synthase
VNDRQILSAQSALAAEGIFLEPSSAAAVAALENLARAGAIAMDGDVVVVGTSSGLKDVRSAAGQLPPVPTVEPHLADLLNALSGTYRFTVKAASGGVG